MEVTFTKSSGRKDLPIWVAQRGKSRIPGSIMGCDPTRLPHDVVTLIIEREMGVVDGFFGTVAAGGTFRSMAKKRTASGKAAIARSRPTLRGAEGIVHVEERKWRAGEDTPCRAALDEALAEWMALPTGGTMTLSWPTHAARPSIRRRRRR